MIIVVSQRRFKTTHLSCNVVAITYCLLLSIFRTLRPIILAVMIQIGASGVLQFFDIDIAK